MSDVFSVSNGLTKIFAEKGLDHNRLHTHAGYLVITCPLLAMSKIWLDLVQQMLCKSVAKPSS